MVPSRARKIETVDELIPVTMQVLRADAVERLAEPELQTPDAWKFQAGTHGRC